MSQIKTREAYVEVEDGFRVWTKSIGGGTADDYPALLILHGGPGGGHDYLSNLASLASNSQKVIFYDQLGCGKSDQPNDPTRWEISRFVKELATIRGSLNLHKVILLGQSWGGMLAIEYLLTDPEGVSGLILSNSLSSASIFAAEILRLKNQLPASILNTLIESEAKGDINNDRYESAVKAFYCRHILRMDPMPDQVWKALNSENQSYQVMWGSNEFNFTGNLRYWERTNDLHQIQMPTLIISGEFDESTPAVNQVMHKALRNSKWITMPGCSHLPNLENPDHYIGHISEFLDQIYQDRPMPGIKQTSGL